MEKVGTREKEPGRAVLPGNPQTLLKNGGMNMETRKNAGYEIIATVRVSRVQEIVIGRNRVAPDPYVCWYCLNGDDYFLGQYRGSYEAALKAMTERINTIGRSISDDF